MAPDYWEHYANAKLPGKHETTHKIDLTLKGGTMCYYHPRRHLKRRRKLCPLRHVRRHVRKYHSRQRRRIVDNANRAWKDYDEHKDVDKEKPGKSVTFSLPPGSSFEGDGPPRQRGSKYIPPRRYVDEDVIVCVYHPRHRRVRKRRKVCLCFPSKGKVCIFRPPRSHVTKNGRSSLVNLKNGTVVAYRIPRSYAKDEDFGEEESVHEDEHWLDFHPQHDSHPTNDSHPSQDFHSPQDSHFRQDFHPPKDSHHTNDFQQPHTSHQSKFKSKSLSPNC